MSDARDELLGRTVAWYAEHGIRDTSLRTLAAGIGTSQRMLHYHFGSREDVLSAVIETVCAADIAALREYVATSADPWEAGDRNWRRVAATASTFGALFFELAAHAMHDQPYARPLRTLLVDDWVAAFAAGFATLALPEQARELARLSLAVGRGVLFELALTGDRPAADAAIAAFTELLRARLSAGT